MMLERFVRFESVVAYVALERRTSIVEHVLWIVDLLYMLLEFFRCRKVFLTTAANVGFTAEFFQFRYQEFLLVIVFDVPLEHV